MSFLKGLVVFPAVPAEDGPENLLRVVERLVGELGYEAEDEVPGERSGLGGAGGAMAGLLDPGDELLVAGLRRSLARVATASLGGAVPEGRGESAVAAALDGAEMVMRGEIVMGNADRLPALLPGFVFLVTLPLVDQDRALELSRRCARLIERM